MNSRNKIKIFEAFVTKDDDAFYKIANEMIEEEEKKKHHFRTYVFALK